MATHIQQTHLFDDGFDVDNTNNEVSAKSITNVDRTVKVTANEDNVEFQVTNSTDIEITSSGDLDFKMTNQGLSFLNGETWTGEDVASYETRIGALENTAFNSGRSFLRFNDGFTIDRTNIATYEDKNILYTARNDKPFTSDTRPDIILPNDTEIQASGEPYPIIFEFTHLGGSARTTNQNVVRFFLDGVEVSRLLRDDVVIITKPSASENYTFNIGNFDPNDTLLPTGVFNLKTDTPINNISTIATELSGVTIVAGDAYLVETGGNWSGFVIPDNSVLVAVVNSASLTDSTSNEDWLLLDNPRVNAKNAALLANFNQNGNRFTASRNVFVDEANVIEFNSMASGTPLTINYLDSNPDDTNLGTARESVSTGQSLQFSDLQGGTLELSVVFNTSSSSGFLPELVDIELDYGSGNVFTFPLTGISPDSGLNTIEITIPNSDYSGILNTDCDITLNYNFRGVAFLGSFTVMGLVNILTGTLRNAVKDVANASAAEVENRLQTSISQLGGRIDQEGSALNEISDRISPYRNEMFNEPDTDALFLDSTGLDSFPSDLSTMSQVSPSNPRFTAGDIALYVAVIGGNDYVLKNVTQSSEIALDNSEVTVTLGESRSFNGRVYFVYRVTGLTIGNVFEVERTSLQQVVAWQEDIDQLERDIERIDAELSHAALNLPDEVVQVLENDVAVTEETNAATASSDYNNSLGTSGTQKVFFESSPNTPSGGTLNSEAISANSANSRYRNKLLYVNNDHEYGNADFLVAFDGVTTSTPLVSYINGVLNAKVFVPAIPSGSQTDTLYPAPATRVSGAGIWQTVEALTFQNGIPVPEADELFFTRNLPSSSTTLNIQYRGHANGNIFGSNTTTLNGVGGNSDVSTTFNISDGSETAIIEVRWSASSRNIRVSVTERVNTGLPTINDIQVILSFSETRTVPATPATTRDVPLENQASVGSYNVIGVKPSSSGNLILVGDIREVDTGYAYTTLFGSSEDGYLTVMSGNAIFFDYENLGVTDTLVRDLENHATLPQYGLFTINYTHESIVTLDTRLRVENSEGDQVNVGEELILVAPDSTRWRLTVNNSGQLTTTQVT